MYKVRLVEKVYKIKTKTIDVDGEKKVVEDSRMEWDKTFKYVFVVAISNLAAIKKVKAAYSKPDTSKAGYETVYKVGRAYACGCEHEPMTTVTVEASEIVRDANWRETVKTIGV